ncbi:Fip1-domain-containing protein, partial [Rhodotorula sp. JG-1b]
MEIDDDEAFLAQPATAQGGSAVPTANDQEDEEEEEEDDSEDDLEIILDGDGVPPPRRPLPSRPVAGASPTKPTMTTAPAPSATTEYAPLDRSTAGTAATTSVRPPSALPGADVTATDKASTAALAAHVVDQSVAGAAAGEAAEEGAAKQPAAVAAPVPHGSLVPLNLNPDPNPTFDVDALPIKDADGNDLFDLDLDALEEKPWRQPGANLADYFNYGMNEATWKNYVRKQREMRQSESVAANPFVGFANGDNLAQAWADLSSENKSLLLATIMGFQPHTMPAPAQMQQMMQQMMGGMGMGMGGGAAGAGMNPAMMQQMAAAAAAGMNPAHMAQMAQQMAAQAQAQQQGGAGMMRPGMMTPQQMQALGGAAQGQGQVQGGYGGGGGGPSMPMGMAGTPMHHPAVMMGGGGGGAQSPMMMMANANGHGAAGGENGFSNSNNDEIK